jgi:hypothetical protein
MAVSTELRKRLLALPEVLAATVVRFDDGSASGLA